MKSKKEKRNEMLPLEENFEQEDLQDANYELEDELPEYDVFNIILTVVTIAIIVIFIAIFAKLTFSFKI